MMTRLGQFPYTVNALNFCVQDLEQGLNYKIAADMYNTCMRELGEMDRVAESVSNAKFCTDMHDKLSKLLGGLK